MKRFLVFAALTLMAHHAHGQQKEQHHHHGSHGNPADFEAYLGKLEDPSRDEWQKPDEVVAALGVKPGQTVCDIGGGPGYFSLRFAKIVGEKGAVYAVDVEPKMLEVLRDRLKKAGVHNVVPVLALEDDPLVPRGACDLVLVVDTYHHFPNGVEYLKTLRKVLKPGGRFANIDFQAKDTPVGPPVEMRVSREKFLADAEAAGWKLAKEHTFLPHQYFLVFEAK